MMLLLDTSVVIDIANRRRDTIAKMGQLKSSYPEMPKISFMTYFEFIYGLRSKKPQNKQKALAFIENFDVVQATKNTANILATLKEGHGAILLSDLFIAAQAIENNMMIATKNMDFEKISEVNKIII
ncbi:MAG: type II toxin-antitoxin system VapC family toxin [Candidatus Aenigmarchaeota archaeon]|nr:type II toxin-antitoxin system VapC family toxin [Candidatus Aenigmarchaeota archaeon]